MYSFHRQPDAIIYLQATGTRGACDQAEVKGQSDADVRRRCLPKALKGCWSGGGSESLGSTGFAFVVQLSSVDSTLSRNTGSSPAGAAALGQRTSPPRRINRHAGSFRAGACLKLPAVASSSRYLNPHCLTDLSDVDRCSVR